ncbi:MAG: hypothetical protein R6U96_02245 [Promethearchaeia archaeon]
MMENNDSELECYLKIIRYFQERENKEKTEIWKSSTLIHLMEKLKEIEDEGIEKKRNVIKNSLILLMSLFENIPPDVYNNRGVHINRLSEEDKEPLKNTLKEEVLIEANS